MNSDNLGVGALTLAHIAILEEAARKAGVRPQFRVLGWDDSRAPYFERDDIEVVGLRLKDFARPVGGLFALLRGCDMVLDIGAGDSFSDIYGNKRIAVMLAAQAMTLAARRPLLFSPQTIGPFQKDWSRKVAVSILRRAHTVTTRDDLSTAYLREIGYGAAIVEATDVALRLPYERAGRPAGGKTRVGINVSGLLYNGGYNRDNMFGLRDSYKELIRTLLYRLTERSDIEVHLVPHVISDESEVEDDYRASLLLAEDYPSLIVAPKFKDPIEAKSYISGMDFFAGARMHACIAAFSTGVPVLPMAYSRKFKGLFGTLGYDLLADCQNDSAVNIISLFETALADREALRDKAVACHETGLARLRPYEDAVVSAMRTIADRKG
jgi:polysaccharide pyruvyl transferase WcaK-like protein